VTIFFLYKPVQEKLWLSELVILL